MCADGSHHFQREKQILAQELAELIEWAFKLGMKGIKPGPLGMSLGEWWW